MSSITHTAHTLLFIRTLYKLHHMDIMLQIEAIEEILEYADRRPHRRTKHARDSNTGPSAVKIEPIENPGGVRVHLLPRNTAYIIESISLLQGTFTMHIAPQGITSFVSKVPPSEFLINHIAVETQRGRIKLSMNTFTIEKKTGGDRLIGHTALLNAIHNAKGIHLINLSTLLALLAGLGPTLYFLEMDFKNYFPQIPLGTNLQPFMGIVTRDPMTKKVVYLLQTVLTQGWNCSTFIAQSITWAAIQYTEPDENNLGLELESTAETPPAFSTINHTLGRGIIIVIYDNILVACNSTQLSNLWDKRLERNMKRFNILRKYCTQTTNSCTFCGIDISLANGSLAWRTTSPTFEAWQTRTIINNTAREAAKILGTVMRQDYVQVAHIQRKRPALLLLQTICQRMATTNHNDWDTPNTISDEETTSIHTLRDSMNNNWCTHHTIDGGPDITIVTDATPTKICYIIYDKQLKILTRQSLSTEHTEISLAESNAVLAALSSCPSFTEDTHTMIVIDNTAAGRCIAKGYSTNKVLDAVVELIHAAAARNNIIIRSVVDIRSCDNLADVGTRDNTWTSADAILREKNTLFRIKECTPLFAKGAKWIGRQ
jgi:hypothetical protein